jgi:hypothetical protein
LRIDGPGADPRTSRNAPPGIDILAAISLNCLLGGTRCSRGRRLQNGAAVAKITGIPKGRLFDEDEFRRLWKSLDAA